MLVLGIILVLVATGVVVAALVGGGDQAVFDLGAVDVQTSTFGAFLAGAATVVVLVLGIGLIQVGVRRARRRRQDKKELNRLSKKVEAQESAAPGATAASSSSSTDTSTTDTRVDDTRTDTTVTDQDRPRS